MTQRRCHACHEWYDAKLTACGHCHTPRHAYSSHLHTAKLNRHLLGMAESASREPSRAPVTSNVNYADLAR